MDLSAGVGAARARQLYQKRKDLKTQADRIVAERDALDMEIALAESELE